MINDGDTTFVNYGIIILYSEKFVILDIHFWRLRPMIAGITYANTSLDRYSYFRVDIHFGKIEDNFSVNQ